MRCDVKSIEALKLDYNTFAYNSGVPPEGMWCVAVSKVPFCIVSFTQKANNKTISMTTSSSLSPSALLPSAPVPRVLTIAGSDPSGGAGIEADLKTITALGCYGLTCIDALTIQNTNGVSGKRITDEETINSILQTDFEDGVPDAIKVGMMTVPVMRWFQRHGTLDNLVVDPIISSSSGYSMAKQQLVKDSIEHVYGKATLLTPNVLEASKIMELVSHPVQISNIEEMKDCAKQLCDAVHCRAVLLKAGHMPAEKTLSDVLYDSIDGSFTEYLHPRILDMKNSHGTGCTLSSAIACHLAMGYSLADSIKLATIYLHNALIHADPSLGLRNGPVNHLYY